MTKRLRFAATLSAALLISIVSGNLNADMVTIANHDFELGSAAPPNPGPGGTTYIGHIPGWNVVNLGGVFEPDFVSEISYPASVQNITGNYVAYSENHTFGMVSQLIAGRTLRADRTYILSADFGHRLDANFAMSFGFFRLENPFPTSIRSISAVDPGAGNFTRQTIIMHGSDIPLGDLGEPFRIGFRSQPTGFIGDFDNVTLFIVPEPMALTAFAPLLVFAAVRRRRR